ncbi:alpha-glucan family phosphorylase [Salinisphaera hydrothermalis]|uniref:alpha-glucan family phosphorylase n=1 Tax=Salinisphaera hydrothermalis TaxID=563188 RepID=UPI003341CE74
MSGQKYVLEVQARLPESLSELKALSENLLYAWDRHIRGLFWRMDTALWERCGHNPKVFLRRISQQRIDELAGNAAFLEEYQYVLGLFRTYRDQTSRPSALVAEKLDSEQGLIAYFCAEYGLHESLPLYSGGLGILAGDHCKAASGLGLPFVAVGLMYRQGYFRQQIERDGSQKALFQPHDLRDLPITLVCDDNDAPLQIVVPLPGRDVVVQIWRAEIGHLALYLLDTDVEGNDEADCSITFQLYGGDKKRRIEQELVLGVGGVRALRALGLEPSVWHVNEGHAAFLMVERCREAIAAGTTFEAGLEQVAAATVFTTHTPVAAGHDVFEHDLAAAYLAPYAKAMNLPLEQLLALGQSEQNHTAFNMTTLALRASRYQNAVSRIHRGVTAEMEAHIWPQVPIDESPLQYVTNGVHVQTFLSRQWSYFFDMHAPGWRARQCDHHFWHDLVASIPDQQFWLQRMSIKADMLDYVGNCLARQYRRQGVGEAHIERRLAMLKPTFGRDPMVLVFARRFATYKRATLLLRDAARLAALLNDPERPVILLFAGKAHPADEPGQALIRALVEQSQQPEFAGKLFVLEDYDLAMGRQLVAGADVWLNTPLYPMEACGTSGQKAGLNGALNVSVLDGWWGEGFQGDNGWAITPYNHSDPEQRDHYEAEDLLDLLEDEVIPLYFNRGHFGYSPGWVARAKASMYTVLPHFNAQRMLLNYIENLYIPATRHGRRLARDNGKPAAELVAWKRRVADAWPGVTLSRSNGRPEQIDSGEPLELHIEVQLQGLSAEDLRLECVMTRVRDDGETEAGICCLLAPENGENGTAIYRLAEPIEVPGRYEYQVRAYPHHPMLAHPFETGLMRWL